MKIKENDTLYCIKAFKNLNVGDVVTVASVTEHGLFICEEPTFFYPEKNFVSSVIDKETVTSDLA